MLQGCLEPAGKDACSGTTIRLDARLGWRLAESVELSVAGQSFRDPWRFEFGQVFWLVPTQVKRNV